MPDLTLARVVAIIAGTTTKFTAATTAPSPVSMRRCSLGRPTNDADSKNSPQKTLENLTTKPN